MVERDKRKPADKDLAIILVPPVTCSVRLLCAGCHERTLVRR